MSRSFAALCCILFATEAFANDWKAAAAKIAITPEKPVWMSGYASRSRPADGKLHDLWAKALAFEDPNGHRGVLVTMDLVGIDRALSVAVCDAIKGKCGLPREAIFLNCSHTHSGPVIGGNLSVMYNLDPTQQKLVDDYTKSLRDKLVRVAGDALGKLEPAELTWNNGLVTFATNRRTNKEAEVPMLRQAGLLKGPVDHQVPVLCVRDPQRRIKAVVFGYACHSTVLPFYEWCGDYPGFAQLEVEKNHPDAVALFWAGCGGDQNPLPRRSVAYAEKYGKELADGVEAVLRAPVKPVSGDFAAAYSEIDAPFADLPSRERIVEDTTAKDRYIAARAKLLLKELDKNGSLHSVYPYPVQAWRLGPELLWVTLGGEVVVDYSLRIKREIGPANTWVAGYSNDVMAYIPSLRVLKEGGYEGGGAMIYYGQPTVWGPRIEEAIVAGVHDAVKKVRPQLRLPASR